MSAEQHDKCQLTKTNKKKRPAPAVPFGVQAYNTSFNKESESEDVQSEAPFQEITFSLQAEC